MPSESCQFVYENLTTSSVLDPNRTFWWSLRRKIWNSLIQGPIDFVSKKQGSPKPWRKMKKHLWQLGILGISEYVSRILPTTRLGRALFGHKGTHTNQQSPKQKLNLQPGDWVEIKSFEEIFATLNSQGKYRGLAFTKEMLQYCGKRFRVHKRLDRIILEATGEMRTIKAPTVILENVLCKGEFHGNCDRTCFCFWREKWLKPVSGPTNELTDSQE